MQLYKIKKITIITEATILPIIIQMAIDLGVSSYTVDRVGGKGEHGLRFEFENDISGLNHNVRIEFIAREDLLLEIADKVETECFNNYAGVIYLQDVEIIRAKKFGIPE